MSGARGLAASFPWSWRREPYSSVFGAGSHSGGAVQEGSGVFSRREKCPR